MLSRWDSCLLQGLLLPWDGSDSGEPKDLQLLETRAMELHCGCVGEETLHFHGILPG